MKKFAKFLIILCLCCSFTFTGCNLVQKNTDRFLNRTVASVGEINISKRDLITAYNSYGYQYVTQQGYTTEKAIEATIDGLVERQLILGEAKKIIKFDDVTKETFFKILNDDGTEKSSVKIFNANVWQNDVLQECYDGINNQLKSIEDTIRVELDKPIEKEDEKEETENQYKKEEIFKKQVVYENGEWKKVIDELDVAEQPIGDFVQQINGDKSISDLAWKRYIKQLIASEEGKGLDFIESNVFKREVERVCKIVEENKYITEFEAIYNNKSKVDDLLNKRVVDKYKELVRASYAKYQDLADGGYKQYCADMQEDSSKVYYHPYSDKFVSVSHVLIKFSDDQIKLLNDFKDDVSKGYKNQEQYDEFYKNWLTTATVKARDEEGKEYGLPKTVNKVYEEIFDELAKYNSSEDKAIAFNKFLYKYGQDEGIMNAANNYVVNLDTEIEDKMVKNFADTSRQLAKDLPDGGNISKPVFVSQENYSGYHIIFNAGIVKNDFNIDNLENVNANYLYNKKIKSSTSKTFYDLMYEKVTTSDYANYRTSLIKQLKQDLRIVYFVSAYKDMF